MTVTFKQFIIEDAGEKMATKMAQHLLGSMDVDQMEHIPEQVSSGARHHGHKYVDTVNGPWVLTHYKNGDNQYIKVDPPKGSAKKTMYFIPHDTVTEAKNKISVID